MTALALGLGLVLLIPAVATVSASTEDALDMVGWLIWGVFCFEYLVLLWLAPDRWSMVRAHPIELILILLPVLRPLRALRLLRIFVGVAAGLGTVRAVLERRGMQWFSFFVLAVVGLGACFTLAFERQEPEAQSTSITEALWWAIVTSTTVGYGDYSPVSAGGRGVAVLLMLLGVSVFSVVTANIASYFVERDAESDIDRLNPELAAVHAKLDRLLATVDQP